MTTSISADLQERLTALFGGRVNFDRIERNLYSQDVGTLPDLMEPLADTTIAGGVVQPKTIEEISQLVRLAEDAGVPIFPRGKATAGYGGCVPTAEGLVVDLSRMNHIAAIYEKAMTATVQPGVIWEDLESALNKRGLALACYPSSAPSSTVGGWLAQGGGGYGSLSSGWFVENVIYVKAVSMDGTVETISGSDIRSISGACGINGIIGEIAVRVRKAFKAEPVAAAFDSPDSLQKAVDAVEANKELPLFSASFVNPTMIRLKAKTPPRLHHGHPVHEDHPNIPEAYILTVVLADPTADQKEALKGLISAAGGRALSDEAADYEWAERFEIMKIKRLGPSLIPAEARIPLKAAGAVLKSAEKKIKLPLAVEGMLVGGADPQIILLGFIPHDQRKFGFNLAYGLSLSMLKAARKFGGHAYATGLYFRGEADDVYEPDHLSAINARKLKSDPLNLLNPGKVAGGGFLSFAMKIALVFEPLVRFFGNMAKPALSEVFQDRAGLPGDVVAYAYACARCGYCVDECDEFYGRGWESHSPRGKWSYLRMIAEGKAKWDQNWVDKFLICTTCEMCNIRCPLDLPIEPAWLKLRGLLVDENKKMTFPPFEMMAASLEKEGNIWASYRRERSDWIPEAIKPRIKPKADICYFAGCTASYVEQDIAQGTVVLLDKAGVEFTTMGNEENCCGIPMLVAGLWTDWENNLRKNVRTAKEKGIKTMITSCPACWLVWRTFYPEWCKKLGIDYDIETKHYSEVVTEALAGNKFEIPDTVCKVKPRPHKVAFHDSCHIGRAGGIYEPPRDLIRAIPGIELVEMHHNREQAHCCGSVLSLIGEPKVAHVIGDARIREAQEVGADAIISLCPCCQFQFRVSSDRLNSNMPIWDLAHFTACNLGVELADPTPHALTMWAVFEKFVYLMSPDGMADLMMQMFPELIAAMPKPMLTMMRGIKALPKPIANAMFAAMTPVMPMMFPILLPKMLPKVLPPMLDRVAAMIPMPDQMKEQMPDMMPKVMNRLMPNMLPMLTPKITKPMIRYLQENKF